VQVVVTDYNDDVLRNAQHNVTANHCDSTVGLLLSCISVMMMMMLLFPVMALD
jgi:hypothetical protein